MPDGAEENTLKNQLGNLVFLVMLALAAGCSDDVTTASVARDSSISLADADSQDSKINGDSHAGDTVLQEVFVCKTDIQCFDNKSCTIDTCVNGACVHSQQMLGTQCDAGVCYVGGKCDGLGNCLGQLKTCPSDNNPCTTESCDFKIGCVVQMKNGACDDGNPCTTDDSCASGDCVGKPACKDDKNPCTVDCDLVSGKCGKWPISQIGVLCDDSDDCTVGETCHGLQCYGGNQFDCDDGNKCTSEECKWGGCKYEVNTGVECGDGTVCTINDVCNSTGTCVGKPVNCDDNNPATNDWCDPASGCKHTKSP